MDGQRVGRRLDADFGGRLAWAAPTPKRLYVNVPPDLLLDVVASLHEQLEGVRLATSTGIDLRDGVGVFHHFVVNGSPLVLTLKVVGPKPAPSIPSIAARLPSALWIEREMAEMLGIVFEGHPDPRPLHKARAFDEHVRPLRRDFDVRSFKEEIGEQLDF